jgi:hypothetical protein
VAVTVSDRIVDLADQAIAARAADVLVLSRRIAASAR